MSLDAKATPPPDEPGELLAWAVAQGVDARLDDVLVAPHGDAGRTLPSHHGEVLTYRQILVDRATSPATVPRGRIGREALLETIQDLADTARRYLWRMANLAAVARAERGFLDTEGRAPEDPELAAFARCVAHALRDERARDHHLDRPAGTYECVGVRYTDTPEPMLRYLEHPLVHADTSPAAKPEEVAVLCIGWQDGPLRLGWVRGERAVDREVTPERRVVTLQAVLDFLHDPRQAQTHAALAAALRHRAWEYALGSLDEQLGRLERDRALPTPAERLAFRVVSRGTDVVDVVPLVQKQTSGGTFSRGTKVQWFNLPERPHLSPAERDAYQAYDDRFARRSQTWGGALSAAQIFGILRALVDHPCVFLEGERQNLRLEIRQGRLRLRFISATDGTLTPVFELLGQTWSPTEAAALLRNDAFLVYVTHPPHASPQVLLAQVGAEAVAVIEALRTSPRFPPESHDALARRLEPLQESVDIELPSRWTRTITDVPVRLLARLDLVASGALQVRLAVRPVVHGLPFAPGAGPALLLEGEGPRRHGARRDLHAERQAAQALAEQLGLPAQSEGEPWCWRVSEGDPALGVVAALEENIADVTVEWSGDGRLTFHGGVGRRDLRLKVGDRRDWFSVEGGASVDDGDATAPLSDLLAAVRENRRYVAVGARGFARIEESLREALARAEEDIVLDPRLGLQVAAAALVARDSLHTLVEEDAQIDASAAFRAFFRRLKQPIGENEDLTADLPSDLAGRLRPYQSKGVAWMARMASWGSGVVLADEMGLGKTIQTLAMLALRAHTGPALVIAPTSVVGNWMDEAARFVPGMRTALYRGPDRANALKGLGPGDILVTSYAIATMDAEALSAIAFGSLVLDEAQAVKNAMTERARALRGLDAAWRVGLTGTPIENHLGELWSIFRMVAPGLFGTWDDFRGRYAVPIEKFGDADRRAALSRRLRPFVLRRMKAEVAPDLPARTELVRRIQLSDEERGLYEQLRQSVLEELAEAKKNPDRDARNMQFVLLAALTRLRQLCCHPRLVDPASHVGSSKADHLLELVGTLRDDGHKILAFSQFRSFLDLLAPRLRQEGNRVLVLDGTTPAAVRAQRIAAFQRGDADVFLISLKAGGFGVNLTAADTVIHLDPWWNPAVEDQATARAHRVGQAKPVTAVRLVATDTVEEAVIGLHAAKRTLAIGVLEGTDTAGRLDVDGLMELLGARR